MKLDSQPLLRFVRSQPLSDRGDTEDLDVAIRHLHVLKILLLDFGNALGPRLPLSRPSAGQP